VTAAARAEENWPEFRGPHANGHAESGNPPTHFSETENVRWKTAIHDKGWSSPVVWGKQIWLTTATEEGKKQYAICVDRETGKVLFDLLLFENEHPAATKQYNSFASPTPAIEKGRVYVSFGSYGTACLDTATGKPVWQRRDLPCNHFRGPASSPILFENLMIVHYDGFDYQYAIALDKQTGETVWKADRNVDYGTTDGDTMKAFSTPTVINVGGKQQLISVTSKAALALDPKTGKEIWRVRFESFSSASRPFYDHGLVYIDTGFGKADLLAVRPDGIGDVTDTHIAWKLTKNVGSQTSPIGVGDRIYMVHDTGIASSADAKTGESLWTKRWTGSFSASPVYAGGHIYFPDRDGTTHVLKPGKDYEEVGTCKLDAGCMASPAVVGDALILRTATHLYCLEDKHEQKAK
jgi:outer membrane protein assembly factor BamB